MSGTLIEHMMSDHPQVIFNPVPDNERHQFAGVWERHPTSTDLEPIAFCRTKDGRLLLAGVARFAPSENIEDAQEAELRLREEEEWEDEEDGDEGVDGDEYNAISSSIPSPTSSDEKMWCILRELNDKLGREEYDVKKAIDAIVSGRDVNSYAPVNSKGDIGTETVLVIFDPDNEAVYFCKTDGLYSPPPEPSCFSAYVDHLPDDIRAHAVDFIRQLCIRDGKDVSIYRCA